MNRVHKKAPVVTLSLVSIVLVFILLVSSLVIGKENFFFYFNYDGGRLQDILFTIGSKLGSGWIYIPVILYLIILKKKWLSFFVILLCMNTLVCQVIKRTVREDRPSVFIKDVRPHTVAGEVLNTKLSFPSGHTSTAFLLVLFFSFMSESWFIAFIMLLYGLWVGYSRVYLAQHFPIDISGGIAVAIVSFWITYYIYRKYFTTQDSV
ncbi:MAG: phosphatase PAP2 family protein [Phycisphaerales bacterium]|nr:phosphatase PAP2 family protein [Phycisphaerales bacterium]